MSAEEDRLLDICRHMTVERDSAEFTKLIGKLNQELEPRADKKPPQAQKPEPKADAG